MQRVAARGKQEQVGVLLHPEGELYLCGPMRLIDEARRVWSAAGRNPARLRFETFASSGAHPPEPFRVTVSVEIATYRRAR